MIVGGYVPMPCVDCTTDTAQRGVDEYFMVTDKVWAAAGIDRRGGMLCVGCLEARLGRRLTAADFTAVPVNDWRSGPFGLPWHGSARLLNRLTVGAVAASVVGLTS